MGPPVLLPPAGSPPGCGGDHVASSGHGCGECKYKHKCVCGGGDAIHKDYSYYALHELLTNIEKQLAVNKAGIMTGIMLFIAHYNIDKQKMNKQQMMTVLSNYILYVLSCP